VGVSKKNSNNIKIFFSDCAMGNRCGNQTESGGYTFPYRSKQLITDNFNQKCFGALGSKHLITAVLCWRWANLISSFLMMTTSSTISTPFYLGKWYPITGRRRKVTKLKGCLITRYMQQEKKNCLEYLSLLFFWLSRQWSHLSRSCLSIIFLYGARAILAIYPFTA
jgi:hypothetical protein